MAVAATNKGIDWAIRLIGAMLVLAIGFVVVKAVITFTNPESVWKQPSLASATTQDAAANGAQNFTFTTDPFNRKTAAVVEVLAEVGEDAPETTLNLKLTGRTAGSNGTAILRTADGKEGNYRLGDEIVPGVTLQAVNREFLVLDVDGQMQRLTFEKGEETGLTVKSENDPAASSQVKVKARAGTASVNPVQTVAISGDVSTLFQNISLRRVMKDGFLTGYSVKANRPGVNLSQFGFSKGDIVTAIGGTDITLGRPDFLALFEQAEKNGGLDVTVLRNGQIKTIRLGTP